MGHCYSLPTPITAVFSPLLSSIRNRCQFARCFPFTAVFSSPSSLIYHLFQYAALPSSIFRFQSAVFNLSLCHHLYVTTIFNSTPFSDQRRFQIAAVFNSPSFFHRPSPQFNFILQNQKKYPYLVVIRLEDNDGGDCQSFSEMKLQ